LVNTDSFQPRRGSGNFWRRFGFEMNEVKGLRHVVWPCEKSVRCCCHRCWIFRVRNWPAAGLLGLSCRSHSWCNRFPTGRVFRPSGCNSGYGGTFFLLLVWPHRASAKSLSNSRLGSTQCICNRRIPRCARFDFVLGVLDHIVSTVAVLTFVLLLLLLVCSVLWGTFVLVRKARRSIQVDADNWLLAEVLKSISANVVGKSEAYWWLAWIPLLMVLCVFLFLPEIWGVLSHVATPRAGRLPGYQVPIPETWIVLSHNSQPNEGGAWVAGLAGRGMGRGMSSYLYRDFPLSEWSVGILPHTRSESETAPRIPNDARVLEKRTLKIGNETITCVDFSNPYPGWEIERHSTVFVKCSGSSPVLQASLENGCMSKRSTECWKASLVRNHCHPKHNCASNLYSRSL